MANMNSAAPAVRRLGVWFDFRQPGGPSPAHYRECLDLARLADELGYGMALVSEHHADPDGYMPAPHVALGAVAAVTRNLLLGAGLALAPLRSTRALAEELNVLDQLSGGRAIAGLGLGYADVDFKAAGADRRTRGRVLDAHLAALAAVWGEGEGLGGLPVTPSPRRLGGPLVMLGGWARPALERAARHADLFLATVGPGEPYADVLRTVTRLHRACAGRSCPRVVVGTHVWVLEDEAQWDACLAPAIARQRDRYCELAGLPRPAGSPDPEHYLIGTPDAVASGLADLFSSGVDAVCLWARLPGVSHADAQRNLERLATEVAPGLTPGVDLGTVHTGRSV